MSINTMVEDLHKEGKVNRDRAYEIIMHSLDHMQQYEHYEKSAYERICEKIAYFELKRYYGKAI